MHRPRALVIGGSLGGLFSANLLRVIGWDVTVFERSAEGLASRGAGLGTREELFSVMRRIGIACDDSIGVQIRSRVCLDHDGTVACEVPISSVATAWDRVYRALRKALPSQHYQAGIEFERLEQGMDTIAAVFSNGLRAEGELLIAADGIHSAVRKQVMPEVTPRYAGYVGWRGVVDAADIPASSHGLIFCHMNFCFPEGELALSVPMPAPTSDNQMKRAQITWFRPTDPETNLPQLCTDNSGRRHHLSIPPPLIRPEIIAELRSRANILAPQLASLFRALKQPLLQPIFDLESPKLVFGRVVLLGDAAFVARPHVGTGVTKAALDAARLADALLAHDDNLNAALARYEQERSRYGADLVARGRYLGAYLEAQLKPREQRAPNELYRRPETVMRQFGAAGETITGSANPPSS